MTPSVDVRIASMVRTLGDIIIPAIDPDNSLAREQAALLHGHLRMLVEQLPHVATYEQLCLDDMRVVAGELSAAAAGGATTQNAAKQLAAARADTEEQSDKRSAYNRIGFALEELITAAGVDGDGDFRTVLGKAVIQHGLRQTRRERSWFAMTGLDIFKADLPSIPDMVAGA